MARGRSASRPPDSVGWSNQGTWVTNWTGHMGDRASAVLANISGREARTAVVVPTGALPWEPALSDQVEVAAGRWLRVIDVKELLGPGDTGEPVPIATVVALGVG